MLQVAGLRKAAHYMVKPLNIVDLLAILPFYIQHVQNWRLAVVHEGEYEALQNLTSTAHVCHVATAVTPLATLYSYYDLHARAAAAPRALACSCSACRCASYCTRSRTARARAADTVYGRLCFGQWTLRRCSEGHPHAPR